MGSEGKKHCEEFLSVWFSYDIADETSNDVFAIYRCDMVLLFFGTLCMFFCFRFDAAFRSFGSYDVICYGKPQYGNSGTGRCRPMALGYYCGTFYIWYRRKYCRSVCFGCTWISNVIDHIIRRFYTLFSVSLEKKKRPKCRIGGFCRIEAGK